MATIIIRNLDDEVAERLRLQARLRGVSVEQEARRVLTDGTRVSRAEIAARAAAIRSPAPPPASGVDSIREDRAVTPPSRERPLGACVSAARDMLGDLRPIVVNADRISVVRQRADKIRSRRAARKRGPPARSRPDGRRGGQRLVEEASSS
jgi:plasmid stability protein